MRKIKKKNKRKTNHRLKNKSKKQTILPVLFGIALLSLFSETMRTIPAGAKSDNFSNIPFELPKLNSNILEKNLLNNVSLVKEKCSLIFNVVFSISYSVECNKKPLLNSTGPPKKTV